VDEKLAGRRQQGRPGKEGATTTAVWKMGILPENLY